MDFNEATDRLAACPTHDEVADAAGWTSVQTVRQARLEPSSTGYRRPPEGWEPVIAKLARERAAELVKLAEELRPGSHYPLVVGRIVPWFGKAIREGNWTILEVHNPERAHEDEGFPGDGVDVLVVPVSAGNLSRYRDAIRSVLQAL